MVSQPQNETVEKAIKNPSDMYASPFDVVNDKRTTRDEKVKILENWELDENRLLSSEAENMGEDVETEEAAERLQDIQKAKEAL